MKMPLLFIGHGSPMNAIRENAYTKKLREVGEEIPRPDYILSVSAHWMKNGTFVTAMDRPKTIHDFKGFPKALYEIEYSALGSPELADKIKRNVKDIMLDYDWGLDHGTWSILKFMYPKADIPVVQLSLDMTKPPKEHYELGQKLAFLRDENVLILGSGNIAHNLRAFSWEESASVFDWASTFDNWAKDKLLKRDDESLIYHFQDSEEGQLAVPYPFEHYLPILYVLGASTREDELKFVFEGIQNASISMRSFKLTAY